MTNYLSYIICCVPLSFFGQDTIFVKPQDTLLVRVLEISQFNEVSYKNYFNPDGIIRHLSASKIQRIIYENGKEEVRFRVLPSTGHSPASPAFNPEKFILEDKNISMNNRDLTYKAAFKIMLKKDPLTNSDELNEALINAESKQNGQIGFQILGPVCAVGGLYVARRNYYGPADQLKAKTYILTGFGLCVTSLVVAQVYKSMKKKQIRKAVLLYNAEW